MKCDKLSSSTAIQVGATVAIARATIPFGYHRNLAVPQVLVWIECLLLLPIIALCMLTLWSRAFVERLPGYGNFH